LKGISVISDSIIEKTHPINRFFVELYNFLLRHSQSSMKYYFWFIHIFKPNDSELGYRTATGYLKRLLLEKRPDVLVSVHPMVNHYLSRAIEDCNLSSRVKLLTVITDPNNQLWRGWACQGSDLTIAPNDSVREKLIDWGVKPEKIKVMGMAVHPDFVKEASQSRQTFLSNLGLDPERFTICINAGWAGGGNMMAIYRALQAVKRETQVLFLCGHNQKLYDKALAEAKNSSIPTAVLPFHDKMADLMSAVDLMVTKAGGLTTFEAIARRLPIVFDTITEPMPQESGTIENLLEAGLAKTVSKPKEIVGIVEKAPKRKNYLYGTLPSMHSLDHVDAVYEIAREILEYASPGIKLKPRLQRRLDFTSPTDGSTDYVQKA
jgi:UDP-N-acetylglucosamine:LPS N-acetylglucosamine transferase